MANVAVVRIPVPPPAVAPVPPDECTDVVFVGRVAPDKGAHVAIAAFKAMADRHERARLVVVGDGPARRRLEGLSGSDGRIVFTGMLDEKGVSEALGRARVVVVPSIPALRREGLPTVAVEAARHGRPIVTSDDPGLVEVSRLVGGDVVPAGDVGALAEALDRWLSHPGAASEAGAAALEAAARVFDVANVRQVLDGVYADAKRNS
jgi:glycosyltransferase involved in cell wall biosynthesis